jgi:hypothetical protein
MKKVDEKDLGKVSGGDRAVAQRSATLRLER